jgi:hypothetical protein
VGIAGGAGVEGVGDEHKHGCTAAAAAGTDMREEDLEVVENTAGVGVADRVPGRGCCLAWRELAYTVGTTEAAPQALE